MRSGQLLNDFANEIECTCPITREIMRYPIRTSDGKAYELKTLFAYIVERRLSISPYTRQPITSAELDIELKTLIDSKYGESPLRHEDYLCQDMLAKIQTALANPQPSLNTHASLFFNSHLMSPMGLLCAVTPNLLLMVGLCYLAKEMLYETPPSLLLLTAGIICSLIAGDAVVSRLTQRH